VVNREASLPPLPEFERPPLVETALGVEFPPIEGWTPSHFQRFARYVERDYPETQIQDSIIGSVIERFGEESRRPQPIDIDFQSLPLRWWLVSDARGELIQLQRDRFVHNWRKLRDDQEYPRYVRTREMFNQGWAQFLRFLAEQKLPPPRVTQAQVDYINHIAKGTGWQTLDDLPAITPWLARPAAGFLPTPEVEVLNLRFVIPPERGRLHALLQPAIRNRDQVEILQLQLTARGQPESSSVDHVLAWLDLCHEWIVRGFAELTTEGMQRIWRRTR